MNILAFDPGETTGWCFVADNGEYIAGDAPLWEGIDELIENLPTNSIVTIERFSLYAGKQEAQTNSTFPACEVIGVIKYLCNLYKVEYVIQGASVKTYFQKRITYAEKMSQHAKDAIMHAFYYRKFKLGIHDDPSPVILRKVKNGPL